MSARTALVFVVLSSVAIGQRAIGPQKIRFHVRSVSPSQNALHVPRSSLIKITFSERVDVASFSSATFHVFGRWSSIHEGTLTFSTNGRTVTFAPDDPFSAGESVFVTASKDIRSARGGKLGVGFSWVFWSDSRASSVNFTLTDVLVPGDTPYGAHGGDLNEDGHLDLAIPNENSSDVSVFLNQGGGVFAPAISYAVGFHCSPSEAADFDFDGHVDLAVANILDHDVSVLFGKGDGSFDPQVRYSSGSQPRGLTLLDADSDGDIDMVTANRNGGNLSLFINRGDGTFQSAQSLQADVDGETGVTASDMNNDGIMDLIVIGFSSDQIAVLLGDGDGDFRVHHVRLIGDRPWMVVWGDVNGDGWNDAGAILAGGGAASIAYNDGTGALLSPTFYGAGSFPIAIDFGDLDGDGDLDLATSSFSSQRYTFYLNNGSGVFGSSFTLPASGAGSCTVLHDIDNDGDVDITAIDEIADEIYLFPQDG